MKRGLLGHSKEGPEGGDGEMQKAVEKETIRRRKEEIFMEEIQVAPLTLTCWRGETKEEGSSAL